MSLTLARNNPNENWFGSTDAKHGPSVDSRDFIGFFGWPSRFRSTKEQAGPAGGANSAALAVGSLATKNPPNPRKKHCSKMARRLRQSLRNKSIRTPTREPERNRRQCHQRAQDQSGRVGR